MKNLILLILLAFAFTACKKDNPAPISSEEQIIGSWKLKKSTIQIKVLTQDGTNPQSNMESKDENVTLTFHSDNTFSTEGDATYVTISSTDTTEQVIYYASTGSWSISNSTLSLTSPEDTSALNIVALSSSNLELEAHDTTEINVYGDIYPLEITSHSSYTK